MTNPDSPALDLDRLSYEIEACAPEFERRSLPYNQSGLTLAQVARELLVGATRLRDELTAARAERDHYLRSFRAEQEETRATHGKWFSAQDQIEHARRQRDAAREQAKQAQAVVTRTLAELTNPMWYGLLDEDVAKMVDEIIALLKGDAAPAAAPQADEPKPTYTGTIGYDERTDHWTMTCSDHGEVYRSTDGTADAHDECIRAWQSHCTTMHGEEAQVDGSDWLVPHAREEFLRKEPLPAAAPDPAVRPFIGCQIPMGNEQWCGERIGHDGDCLPLFAHELPPSADAEPVPAGGEDGSGTEQLPRMRARRGRVMHVVKRRGSDELESACRKPSGIKGVDTTYPRVPACPAEDWTTENHLGYPDCKHCPTDSGEDGSGTADGGVPA